MPSCSELACVREGIRLAHGAGHTKSAPRPPNWGDTCAGSLTTWRARLRR